MPRVQGDGAAIGEESTKRKIKILKKKKDVQKGRGRLIKRGSCELFGKSLPLRNLDAGYIFAIRLGFFGVSPCRPLSRPFGVQLLDLMA